MGIIVQNEVVRKNIALVKALIDKQKDPKHKVPPKKVYNAYIHRETGEIVLPPAAREELRKRDWKPISLRLRMDDAENHRPVFEVLEENEFLFHTNDIQPLASRIIGETMKTLNGILAKVRREADIDEIFKQITFANIEPSLQNLAQKNMIVQTWHPVDRLEAENLLIDASVGTFLFRKDEYAAELERQLVQLFPEPMECFTLTYLQPKRKISDKTIVKKGEWWFVYNDDLGLNDPSFSNLDELLRSFKGALKFPLLT